MPKCVIKSGSGVVRDKEVVFPVIQKIPRMDANIFIDKVVEGNQVSKAQVLSVLAAIESQLGVWLSLGHTVEVPGIGTFKPVVEGTVEQKENGRWSLKDAKIPRVKYRPCREIRLELRHAKFELADTKTQAANYLSDDEALKQVTLLCERDGNVTPNTYSKAVGCTVYMARKTLERFKEADKLICPNGEKTNLYRLA